jgi:hypothetical protein
MATAHRTTTAVSHSVYYSTTEMDEKNQITSTVLQETERASKQQHPAPYMLCVLLELLLGTANLLGAVGFFRFRKLSCSTSSVLVQTGALQIKVVELATKLPVRISIATSTVGCSRRESRSVVLPSGVHGTGNDIRLRRCRYAIGEIRLQR